MSNENNPSNKDEYPSIKERRLVFYQAIIENRLHNATTFNSLCITLSAALIAILPNMYKETAPALYLTALILFIIVVILGLIEYRLDYYQLGSLEKLNNGQKNCFDFSHLTLCIFYIKLTLFVVGLSLLVCLAFSNSKTIDCKENKIMEKGIQLQDKNYGQDDYSSFNIPTNDDIKPKK